MNQYPVSFADSRTHVPDHPDRTARRASGVFGLSFTYQVWSNRKAMAKTIRMQQARASHHTDWNPIINLTDGEGY
ncbi:hypothetical protein LCGC14_1986760 [marine sediment metagenome]|uniref:Uncharacterized protein n=1 Tax=marine sediment metagenome TaxID=412755 RepID=A0A0F9I4B8_9ZZZZ